MKGFYDLRKDTNGAVSASGGITGPGCWPAAFFKSQKQNYAFFIWDKYSYLAVRLHVIRSH